jgi:hypothetical protein
MSEPTMANLAAALAKVQAQLPKLERDRTVTVQQKNGDTYSYSYATLANLSETVLPLLASHGLSFAAMPGVGADGKMCVRYLLLHESGEQLSGEFPISGEGGIQMIGGRITYARRYCLAAIVGVAADEDDEARLSDESPRGTAQRATRATPSARQASSPASDAPAAKTAQRASQPAPPPLPGDDGPRRISDKQLTKLHILMGEAGYSAENRDEGLAFLSGKVGRDLTTSKELTLREAAQIIDALERKSVPS